MSFLSWEWTFGVGTDEKGQMKSFAEVQMFGHEYEQILNPLPPQLLGASYDSDTCGMTGIGGVGFLLGAGRYQIGDMNGQDCPGVPSGTYVEQTSFANITGISILFTTGQQDHCGLGFGGDTCYVVPEPSSLILLATGLVGFAYVRRRRTA